MSSGTMRRSARRWPAVSTRSASSAPEVSVASVRVSETVRTAIDRGWNSGVSVKMPPRFRTRLRLARILHRGPRMMADLQRLGVRWSESCSRGSVLNFSHFFGGDSNQSSCYAGLGSIKIPSTCQKSFSSHINGNQHRDVLCFTSLGLKLTFVMHRTSILLVLNTFISCRATRPVYLGIQRLHHGALCELPETAQDSVFSK